MTQCAGTSSLTVRREDYQGQGRTGTRRVSKIPTFQRNMRSTPGPIMYSVEGMTSMPDGRSQQDIRSQVETVRPCKCGIAKSSKPVTNASILHVDSMLPNENAYTNSVLINVAVTCRHLALELLGVLVPELRSLGVQRRVTERCQVSQQVCIPLRGQASPSQPESSRARYPVTT